MQILIPICLCMWNIRFGVCFKMRLVNCSLFANPRPFPKQYGSSYKNFREKPYIYSSTDKRKV